MRVLTFLHSFEPGGVERIALRLVRQWRALEGDAPLFMGRADGAMRGDAGAELEVEIPPQPWGGTAWWETLWMIVRLPGIIRRLRPDVLFCAGNSYTVVAVAMKCLLGSGCPPIVAKISNDLTRNDMLLPVRWSYRLWLRLQARCLDHVVGTAEPMRAEIAGAMGVDQQAITIIPNPALSRELVDDIAAVPRGCCGDDRGRKFVAVVRLAGQKNVPLMLRAFARGARDEDSLTIIGTGPLERKLRNLARTLGIGDRVAFTGHVAHPALMLRQFDIFLLSSDYEGVPAVILEALAAGLPIIATRCSPSMVWLLEDEAGCQLVGPGDERALTEAIARAVPITDEASASRFRPESFYIETVAAAYLTLFERLAEAAARSA